MLSNGHIELLAAEGNDPTANKISVTSGLACQKLLKTTVQPPTAQRSLNLMGINSVDWTKIYMLPRKVTIEPSLRSFQYKILNNILYLNEKLFKFKIVASPLFSLCKLHNQSIKHLFSTCKVTLTLSKQLCSGILGTGILLPESMDPQTIILGSWIAKTSDFVIINHIILLFKRYCCVSNYMFCVERSFFGIQYLVSLLLAQDCQ